MPTEVASSGGVFKSVGKWGWFSISSIFSFFWKHKFMFLFFLFILPTLTTSVKTAIETKNPIHPFLELGAAIFAADTQVGQDAQTLSEQGVEGLVKMPKPTEGYWEKTKYYWFLIWRVYYNIIGKIYLIFVPAIVFYKISKYRNISEVNKNIFRTIFFFLLYLFVVNTLFVVYQVGTGQITLTIPEGTTQFYAMWLIFVKFLPLNGLYSLLKYLIIGTI